MNLTIFTSLGMFIGSVAALLSGFRVKLERCLLVVASPYGKRKISIIKEKPHTLRLVGSEQDKTFIRHDSPEVTCDVDTSLSLVQLHFFMSCLITGVWKSLSPLLEALLETLHVVSIVFFMRETPLIVS